MVHGQNWDPGRVLARADQRKATTTIVVLRKRKH